MTGLITRKNEDLKYVSESYWRGIYEETLEF